MELLKEFSGNQSIKLVKIFGQWESVNLKIVNGKRERTTNLTYGLPYTSSSECAGLWCTNVSAVYTSDSSLRFDGVGYDVELNPVAFFTRLDESDNEVEDVVKFLS